jgi:hypothetical protein
MGYGRFYSLAGDAGVPAPLRWLEKQDTFRDLNTVLMFFSARNGVITRITRRQ